MNARHTLVKGAIGVFPEEEYAYWLVNTLSWSLPLMIVLGAIVDVLLVYIYMRIAHPWKDILFYKDKTSKKEENEIVDQSRVKQEREEDVAQEISPVLNQEGEFTDYSFSHTKLDIFKYTPN